jgi:hypothetical protein
MYNNEMIFQRAERVGTLQHLFFSFSFYPK